MAKITPYARSEADAMVAALDDYVATAKQAKKDLERAARAFLETQALLKTTGQCPRRLMKRWEELTRIQGE